MLHQGAFLHPPLWKDLDFQYVNAIVKVDAWGFLLLDMLVDEGMMVYVFLYEFFVAIRHLSNNSKANLLF